MKIVLTSEHWKWVPHWWFIAIYWDMFIMDRRRTLSGAEVKRSLTQTILSQKDVSETSEFDCECKSTLIDLMCFINKEVLRTRCFVF